MNPDRELNEGASESSRKSNPTPSNGKPLPSQATPHPADTTLPLHISRKRDHSDDFAELDALRGENQILRENLRILEASYKELEQLFGAKCGELIRLQQRMQFLKAGSSGATSAATPVSGLGQMVRDMELSTPLLRGARDPSASTTTSDLKPMTAEQLRQHGISVVAAGSSAARRMPKRDMTLPPTNPIHREESVDQSGPQTPSESPQQSESLPQEQHERDSDNGEDRLDQHGGHSYGPQPAKPIPTATRSQVYGQIPQQPSYSSSQPTSFSAPPPLPPTSSGLVGPATKPNYYCSLCNIVTNSETALQSHLGGDRHRKKWFRYQQSLVPAPPTAGGAVESEPSGPYCSPQFQGHYGYPPGAYGY